MKRFLELGFLLWLAATGLLRLAPKDLLGPERATATVILYAASFALMFALIRWRVMRTPAPRKAIPAVVGLVLPTLVLDAFSSAFFPSVFPNFSADAAGIFGGWMLICCGGALAAVLPAQ